MIDEIDNKIVRLLQTNARLSNGEIAAAVGLNPSSVFERVKKLERKGIIIGYSAVVDPEKLGKPLLAFTRVTVGAEGQQDYEVSHNEVIKACAEEPDILECHHVAGEDCYIIKIRTGGPKQLESLLSRIRVVTRSVHTVTNIVLTSYKETMRIEPEHESESGQ